MPRPRNIVPLLVLGIALGLTSGNAQTPTNNEPCALPPVTLPLFDATPAAAIAALPSASPAPSVTDIDDDAIRAAVDVIFDCINTGVPASAYAIFTERYLATMILDQNAYQPALELSLTTEADAGSATFTVDQVTGIAPAPGGVSVTVTYHHAQQSFTDTLLLVEADGHWIIDDVIALEPPG